MNFLGFLITSPYVWDNLGQRHHPHLQPGRPGGRSGGFGAGPDLAGLRGPGGGRRLHRRHRGRPGPLGRAGKSPAPPRPPGGRRGPQPGDSRGPGPVAGLSGLRRSLAAGEAQPAMGFFRGPAGTAPLPDGGDLGAPGGPGEPAPEPPEGGRPHLPPVPGTVPGEPLRGAAAPAAH